MKPFPAVGGDGARPGVLWRRVPWEGDIGTAVAPAMLARVLDWSHDDHVVVDLGAVECMGAAGLTALVKARRRLRASGGDLAVCNPPARVRWMLSLFNLTDLAPPDAALGPAGTAHRPDGTERLVLTLHTPISRLRRRFGPRRCRGRHLGAPKPWGTSSKLVAPDLGGNPTPEELSWGRCTVRRRFGH